MRALPLMAVLVLLNVGCGGSKAEIALHSGSLAGDYERSYGGDGSKVLLSLEASGELLIVVDDKATDVYSGKAVVGEDGRFSAVCRRLEGPPVTVAGRFEGPANAQILSVDVSGSFQLVTANAPRQDPGPVDHYAGKYSRAIYDTYPPHRVLQRAFNIGVDGIVEDARFGVPIGRVRSNGIITTDETFGLDPDGIFKGKFLGLLEQEGGLFFGQGTWEGEQGEIGLWEGSRYGS